MPGFGQDLFSLTFQLALARSGANQPRDAVAAVSRRVEDFLGTRFSGKMHRLGAGQAA